MTNWYYWKSTNFGLISSKVILVFGGEKNETGPIQNELTNQVWRVNKLVSAGLPNSKWDNTYRTCAKEQANSFGFVNKQLWLEPTSTLDMTSAFTKKKLKKYFIRGLRSFFTECWASLWSINLLCLAENRLTCNKSPTEFGSLWNML